MEWLLGMIINSIKLSEWLSWNDEINSERERERERKKERKREREREREEGFNRIFGFIIIYSIRIESTLTTWLLYNIEISSFAELKKCPSPTVCKIIIMFIWWILNKVLDLEKFRCNVLCTTETISSLRDPMN